MKNFVKMIDEKTYMRYIAGGAGTLADFGAYKLVDGVDLRDKTHYLIVKFDANQLRAIQFIEVDLEMFYDLCANYMLSLRPDHSERASETLRQQLDAMSKEVADNVSSKWRKVGFKRQVQNRVILQTSLGYCRQAISCTQW